MWEAPTIVWKDWAGFCGSLLISSYFTIWWLAGPPEIPDVDVAVERGGGEQGRLSRVPVQVRHLKMLHGNLQSLTRWTAGGIGWKLLWWHIWVSPGGCVLWSAPPQQSLPLSIGRSPPTVRVYSKITNWKSFTLSLQQRAMWFPNCWLGFHWPAPTSHLIFICSNCKFLSILNASKIRSTCYSSHSFSPARLAAPCRGDQDSVALAYCAMLLHFDNSILL